jgi:hypothetical protein
MSIKALLATAAAAQETTLDTTKRHGGKYNFANTTARDAYYTGPKAAVAGDICSVAGVPMFYNGTAWRTNFTDGSITSTTVAWTLASLTSTSQNVAGSSTTITSVPYDRLLCATFVGVVSALTGAAYAQFNLVLNGTGTIISRTSTIQTAAVGTAYAVVPGGSSYSVGVSANTNAGTATMIVDGRLCYTRWALIPILT